MIPIDRTRLPAVGPDPQFAFPSVARGRLGCGLPVWTVEHRGLPVVTMLLLVPSGSAADPAARPGLAAMTADMLDEGSGERSAIEMHDAFARIGSDLTTEIGPDSTVLALTTLTRFTGRALALLSEVAIRPRFDDADFARVRELRVSRVVQQRDMPAALADRTFARLVYPAHPYGHLASGSEQALRKMSVGEVVEFHQRLFLPVRATLIIVGDGSHDLLIRQAEEAFGDWTGPEARTRGAQGEPAPSDPAEMTVRLAIVDRPGAPQSELRIGHLGVSRQTTDYHALLVLNTILGGQFTSRLNMNLREQKGFTYGVRSSFDFRRGRGPFAIHLGVASSATSEAIWEALAELDAIRGPRPATDTEIDAARAALTRGYPRNFETPEQVLRAVGQVALYDLSERHFEEFVPLVARVDAAAVSAVAAAHLAPARAVVAVVGDYGVVGPSLARLGLGEPVIMAATED